MLDESLPTSAGPPSSTLRACDGVRGCGRADLGFGDLGYTGSGIKTPVLDGLALSGVRLGQCVTWMPNTCPSQAVERDSGGAGAWGSGGGTRVCVRVHVRVCMRMCVWGGAAVAAAGTSSVSPIAT